MTADSGKKKVQIAVIGAGTCSDDEYEAARLVGELIAGNGAILCCGGLGGVMEGACGGAQEKNGIKVGILPDGGDGNQHLDIAVRTGLGHARNAVLAQTADAVIAIGGGYGTLSEIAIALKTGRAVFGYRSWDIEGMFPCSTPEEAVIMAVRAARLFRQDRSRQAAEGSP